LKLDRSAGDGGQGYSGKPQTDQIDKLVSKAIGQPEGLIVANRRRIIMKKVIILMFVCIMFVGCATKQSSFTDFINLPKGHVIDKDKIIDDKDVIACIDKADSYFATYIQPFLTKTGVNKDDLFTKGTYDKFRNTLTVAEWDRFNQHLREYKKLQSNINATAKANADRIINSKEPDIWTGKVFRCQGSNVGLQDGKVIKYAGIKMPEGITNKYSMMVSVMSLSLTKPNLVSCKLTGSYSSRNIPEAYVYCNNLCINEELVKRGYAIAIRDGTDKSNTLIKLEEEAKQNKRGLWAYIEDNPFAEPLY
jgi:endonuclease YncB( thermonuclease family)